MALQAVFVILGFLIGRSRFFRALIHTIRQRVRLALEGRMDEFLKYLLRLYQILVVLAGLFSIGIAAFGLVRITSIIPIAAIVVVFVSVFLSVVRTPKKLMVASGASLAFIFSAFVYEVLQAAIRFIENAVP